MANNCLVTKLKGVVDNTNLPKLGEFTMDVSIPVNSNPNASYFGARFITSEEMVMTIVEGDVVFYSDEERTIPIGKQKTLLPNQANHCWIGDGVSKVSIPNKYAITSLRIQSNYGAAFTVNGDDLRYFSLLSSIYVDKINGTLYLDKIKSNEVFADFSMYPSLGNVVGDLSDLNLSEISLFTVGATNPGSAVGLTGNFIDVVNPNLVTLYPDKGSSVVFCSLEDIVHKLRDLGKTTGTINMAWCGASTANGLTIGGEELNGLGVNAAANIVWTTTTISLVRASDGAVIRTVTA